MLYELLPELALKETRTITVFAKNAYNLPPANYGLVEMYCNDEDCDCRRVFLNVMSSVTKDSVAVIAYGWETLNYYAKWLCRKKVDITQLDEYDRNTIRSLKGPCLNSASPQSNFAPVVLLMVVNLVLMDEKYVNRLKRHYKLFRAKIDESYRDAQSETS
jgi:hypothetical protein